MPHRKLRTQYGWQVRNRHGYPASNEFDDLCIFPNPEKADGFIKYLTEEIGLEESFTVERVKVVRLDL